MPKSPTPQTTVITVSTSEQVESDNELVKELTPEEKERKQREDEERWKKEKEEEIKNRPLSPLQAELTKSRQNKFGGTLALSKLGKKGDEQRQNKNKSVELSDQHKKLLEIAKNVSEHPSDEHNKVFDSLTKQKKDLAMKLYKDLINQEAENEKNEKFNKIKQANKSSDNEESGEDDNEWE